MEKGKVKMFDATDKVINRYLNDVELAAVTNFEPDRTKEIQVTKVSILNKDKKLQARIPIHENFHVEVEYEVYRPAKNALLSLVFFADGDPLLLSSESDKKAALFDYEPGRYKTFISIPAFLFNVGTMFFDVRLHRPGIELIDYKQRINFEITDGENPRSIVFNGNHMGKIASVLDFETTKIQ